MIAKPSIPISQLDELDTRFSGQVPNGSLFIVTYNDVSKKLQYDKLAQSLAKSTGIDDCKNALQDLSAKALIAYGYPDANVSADHWIACTTREDAAAYIANYIGNPDYNKTDPHILYGIYQDGHANVISGAAASISALLSIAFENNIFEKFNVKNLSATDLTAVNSRLSDLTAVNVEISNLEVDSLTADSGKFTDLTATNLTATNEKVTYSGISNLTATNESVTNLTATNETVTDLTATNETVTDLTATNLTATNLTATSETVTDLTATNLTATNLTATSEAVTDLTATNLTATNEKVTDLTATNETVTNLTAANLTATSETVTNLTATTATLSNLTTYSPIIGPGLGEGGSGSYSASNPLVTKNFVNSSINNMVAFYLTKDSNGSAFGTYAELTAAINHTNSKKFWFAGEERRPISNDYCVVLSDDTEPALSGYAATTRYICVGSESEDGKVKSIWNKQYVVNSTPFTDLQWKTLNAEITKGNVVRHTENTAVGSSTVPVYVQANGSVATITSYSGNADSATKLQNARNITITDGIHVGTASSFNGTANISVRLPTDITFTNLTATNLTATNETVTNLTATNLTATTRLSAANLTATTGQFTNLTATNITGTVKGKADSAAVADKLATSTAGTATKPVYFLDGVPKQCSYGLSADVRGNATTTAAGLMSAADKTKLDGMPASVLTVLRKWK